MKSSLPVLLSLLAIVVLSGSCSRCHRCERIDAIAECISGTDTMSFSQDLVQGVVWRYPGGDSLLYFSGSFRWKIDSLERAGYSCAVTPTGHISTWENCKSATEGGSHTQLSELEQRDYSCCDLNVSRKKCVR